VTWSGASDSGSGVDGYSYAWSQSAATPPDTTKDAEETATGTTSPPLADGEWWFHLRTGDNASNWSSPVHLGPFQIDATAPANPPLSSPSHTVGVWSNDATVDVTWSGATDPHSGIDGFSFEWSQSAATVPDVAKDAEETAAGTTSPPRADGSWWLHLRTRDNAGNWSAAAHLGPGAVDHGGEGVDGLVVDQDLHLDEVVLAVAGDRVVEGGVALGDGLQAVVEVEDDLGQGQDVGEDDAGVAAVTEILLAAPPLRDDLARPVAEQVLVRRPVQHRGPGAVFGRNEVIQAAQ
jgi:hypothetical protein